MFFPLFRITGVFLAVPLIGSRLVPVRSRLALALLVSLILSPIIKIPAYAEMSLSLLPLILQEFVIGYIIGFLFQILFQIFVIAGQIIAIQNGLGFGMMVDPVNGINVVSISQLYLIFINIIFFSMNGHLMVFEILYHSFIFLPMGSWLAALHYYKIAQLGSWMFMSAFLVSISAVLAIFLSNITFGFISRLSPQFNIFSVGFPFNMIFGLFIIMLTMVNVVPQFDVLYQFVVEYLIEFMRST
ncbi:MAG: flagellar biosynthetic protein FliR [Pseudomonadota bacterium]